MAVQHRRSKRPALRLIALLLLAVAMLTLLIVALERCVGSSGGDTPIVGNQGITV